MDKVTTKATVRRLKAGPQGISGQVIRQSEWVVGASYHNDGEDVPSIRYLDIVLIYESNGVINRYVCKQTHQAAEDNKPGKTGGNIYWKLLSGDFPLYTPLLIAENGDIKFLQSNRIIIQKADGTITAGISGNGSNSDGIRFWAGSNNPASAPFRVDEEGKVISLNGVFEGEIIASKGSIGGFEIGNDRIGASLNPTNPNGEIGMSLKNDYIVFTDDKIHAYIGTLFKREGNLPILGRFVNTGQNRKNYGILFNIINGSNNHAFMGQGSGTLNGMIEGYGYNILNIPADGLLYPNLDKGNKILCKFTNERSSVGLPALDDVRNALSIYDGSPFTCKITYIGIPGSANGGIYGRTFNAPRPEMMSIKYPRRLDNSGAYKTDRHNLKAGNVVEYMLVHDGGETETSYQAFHISTAQ